MHREQPHQHRDTSGDPASDECLTECAECSQCTTTMSQTGQVTSSTPSAEETWQQGRMSSLVTSEQYVILNSYTQSRK